MHRLALAIAALTVCASTPAAAQLRPLPPADWEDDGHSAACGAAMYRDLGAGLIGARGTLTSLGDCSGTLDLGTARLHVSGVLRRTFVEDSSYALPVRGVDPDGGPTRRDWGDFVLETLIPFELSGPWTAGLRFGARWPTTDNQVGLERDKTDIHAAAMTGYRSGPLFGYVELGVGINGTRVNHIEQQDVLIYMAGLDYRVPFGRVRFLTLGHARPSQRYQRGNEALGEVRVGLRTGGQLWADIEAVAGYAEASPSWGVRIRLGRAFEH